MMLHDILADLARRAWYAVAYPEGSYAARLDAAAWHMAALSALCRRSGWDGPADDAVAACEQLLVRAAWAREVAER